MCKHDNISLLTASFYSCFLHQNTRKITQILSSADLKMYSVLFCFLRLVQPHDVSCSLNHSYDLNPVNPGSVIYKYACATSKRKLHW